MAADIRLAAFRVANRMLVMDPRSGLLSARNVQECLSIWDFMDFA